jgi:CubicO group peptidase (beta-lactamase class C family)
MRKVAERARAGSIGPLLSLLILIPAPHSGIAGLHAQEQDRIPVQELRADDLAPDLDSLFDEYGAVIRDSMASHGVPGLSIVIVDRERILWTAGFGVRDRETGEPVTPETVFSVQSISKLFTGVAAMRAVEDGLLEIDAPVTEYLDDFRVNSRFSERPASRMTVRHLLTHAAGFTHEAPVGNNYDAYSPSMEAHIRSIRDTWLKFPPGTDHAYSNLGVDLVGYILQERSGRAYQDYVDEEILEPLGMESSFVDTVGQRLCSNCAAGHREDFVSMPEYVPMTGSGGVRVSGEDAGRFLQFLLRFGETPEGGRILERSSFEELYRPTGRLRERGWPHMWYGIGVMVHAHDKGRNLIHTNGGGFGYISSMRWYPGQGVGAVVLTNSDDHDQFGDDLTHSVLEGVVARGAATDGRTPDVPTVRSFFTNLPDTTAAAPEAVRSEPTPYRPEWDEYLGIYEIIYGGGFELAPSADWTERRAEVLRNDGHLQLRHPGSEEPEPLIEHEPGLFFGAESGEALDFRDEPPTLRNIELERVEGAITAASRP